MYQLVIPCSKVKVKKCKAKKEGIPTITTKIIIKKVRQEPPTKVTTNA